MQLQLCSHNPHCHAHLADSGNSDWGDPLKKNVKWVRRTVNNPLPLADFSSPT